MLRIALLMSVVITIGALASGTVGADTHEYEITIEVTDQNGHPVQGASVQTETTSGSTNPNGEIVLQLEEGTHTFDIGAAGYTSVSQTETIDSDDTLEVTLEASDELLALREQLDELADTVTALEEDRQRLEEERDELARERDELAGLVEESDRQIEDLQEELQDESMPGFGPLLAVIAVLIGGVFAKYRS